jgi:hypothetical protein
VDVEPDVSPAHTDVVEAPEVAKGDAAALVHAVVADTEVGCRGGVSGARLEAGTGCRGSRLTRSRSTSPSSGRSSPKTRRRLSSMP